MYLKIRSLATRTMAKCPLNIEPNKIFIYDSEEYCTIGAPRELARIGQTWREDFMLHSIPKNIK
jgi:hypothetical protein